MADPTLTRPTVPDVLPRVQTYYAQAGNGAGGSLHIVLDDFNLEDHSVQFCIEWAEERGDTEGAEIGRLLLQMTRSQRGRIAKQASAR